MKYGYLILASERRVLNVLLGDDTDAIRPTIGCQIVEHGTTLASEDQLIVGYDEQDGAPDDEFRVAGVPFPFTGNAILIGIDPQTGDVADRPTMELDEFRRLVSFTSHAGSLRPVFVDLAVPRLETGFKSRVSEMAACAMQRLEYLPLVLCASYEASNVRLKASEVRLKSISRYYLIVSTHGIEYK